MAFATGERKNEKAENEKIPARLSRHLIGASALAGAVLAAGTACASNTKGDKDFGQYLSSLCVTCHQITGQATGGIPPIIAWPDDQFIAVMNAYRGKDRENLVMQNIAAKLNDEEIAALAAYFGSLPHQPAIK